jgi:TRAP-type C4-dicarboxylate transport system substrate-binding protein
MTRGSRICLAAALFAATTVMLPRVAGAADTVELKASLFPPPQNPLVVGMKEWADLLKQKSNGRIVINVFPASQMGPPPRQFDLARTGVADIAVALHGLTPGRFPLIEMTHVPGVLKNNYGSSLAMTEIADQFESENPGVKIINLLVLKTAIIAKNEIKTDADLKGKRIRAAGSVQSDVLKALGGVPTLVQPGDMNDALDKGMVDGISTAYSGMESYKLDDVAKFVTEGDMGFVSFATVMNRKSYDALPADLKKIFDENSGIVSAKIFARALDNTENNYRSTLIKRGIKIAPLADDSALKKAGDQILAQAIKHAESKGVNAKAILEKIRAAAAKYADQN